MYARIILFLEEWLDLVWVRWNIDYMAKSVDG